MSTNHLNRKELNQFKVRLGYSFVDENEHFKMNIAACMEIVSEVGDKDLDNKKREGFHELLRAYTDILSKNLNFSTDYTNCLMTPQWLASDGKLL